ncbi:E3 ubiquitin-protein ligase PUB23 [Striga hermonthica]|uniref:U-box domain-containing protein n=1 Tax=Striga hermonthica TaxID=68872 RepID=A0A9N7P2Z6_STRHE|nr:E3 ubiquitin-protein ligase PUB23 [Striga hermonthica]
METQTQVDTPPDHFRCPISMELMRDPVTISTGVTYDRKNIEKWFHDYRKKTCPATMLPVQTPETTPNHTLRCLIDTWLATRASSSSPELAQILDGLRSCPFRVSWLRKLRSALVSSSSGGGDDIIAHEFVRSGGVRILAGIIGLAFEGCDFSTLRACEEALGVLHVIPFDDVGGGDDVASADCMGGLAVVLRRGSSESRFWAISILLRMWSDDNNGPRGAHLARQQGDIDVDFFKSLLEMASDEVCSRASSCALQLLVRILQDSKKSRLKAIEAGAMCSLVELLPESSRSRCKKILELIKLMCECADGRLALIEHGLGLAAVCKKMGDVSHGATRVAVKILLLVSSFHPTERVLEEMLVCGAVQKMLALLQAAGGRGGRTKERVVRILRMHAGAWRRYPCFPAVELRGYLGLGNDS